MDAPETDVGALESARSKLYKPGERLPEARTPLSVAGDRVLPHTWQEPSQEVPGAPRPKKPLHVAGGFFIVASIFFVLSLGVAGYFMYFGGNTVSSAKVNLDMQGPSALASGDTLPLTITLTNRNPVAMRDAVIEVTFPEGTRSASNTFEAYPRYIENLGEIPSGGVVTRSVNAVLFGGAGQVLTIPVALSYGTTGSNATFTKKLNYDLSISTTPLEVTVATLSEAVSGKPLTLTLTVRSNATVPLENVVLVGALPFGFQVATSSLPFQNSTFSLGTFAPGASRTITLTGVLSGQNSEERVFRFSVGTAKSATDRTLGVTYMSQNATVNINAPFISTVLSVNGSASTNVVAPDDQQNVTVSYTNTLPTNVNNVVVSVTISGNAVDYDTIKANRGFYRSSDRTIIFSGDTDPSLASLAPGASGLGSFRFDTLPADALGASPSINFTVSVSGTRVGQSSVPEQVTASLTKSLKILSATTLTTTALHASGPIVNTGPVPPKPDQVTTYTIKWDVRNQGNAIADGVVRATLPDYVEYTNKTSGPGVFSYEPASRTVTWSVGNIAQGTTAQGAFQVALTPSTSQSGKNPVLVNPSEFSGYDRFAGVGVQARSGIVNIATESDPGYTDSKGVVQ